MVFTPLLGQTPPVIAGGGYLQPRSLVADDHGCFISGPDMIIIIKGNPPICRRFGFCLKRTRRMLPQLEVAEDAFYEVGVVNEADEPHFMATSGTTDWVNFPATRLRGNKPS
jgi:hypothetical protein